MMIKITTGDFSIIEMYSSNTDYSNLRMLKNKLRKELKIMYIIEVL